MLIRKAYRYKLQPTNAQERQFGQFAGCARYVWNRLLAENRAERGLGESPAVNRAAFCAKITGWRHDPATAWLAECHVHVLQVTGDNLIKAYRNWWNPALPAKGPKWKSKRSARQSFGYKAQVRVDGEGRVWLPKIGWVKYRDSRPVEGTIKTATVSRQASGWYASLSCEVEIADPPVAVVRPETIVGLDLGLTDFVVTSGGERVAAPKYYRKAQKKLARAQRVMCRRKKGSARRARARRRVALAHERVGNARADFLHKLSRRMVDENQAIILEDLCVVGLARTRLAKSVHDAGWGEFTRQLGYKAERAGKVVHRVDRFFPSTKTCNACGSLNQPALSDRTFACIGCGVQVDRDLNAAKNIRDKGLMDLAAGQTERLNARGAVARPEVLRHVA